MSEPVKTEVRLIKCIGCGSNVNVELYATPTQRETHWGLWMAMPPPGWRQLYPTGGSWVCSTACADAYDGDTEPPP